MKFSKTLTELFNFVHCQQGLHRLCPCLLALLVSVTGASAQTKAGPLQEVGVMSTGVVPPRQVVVGRSGVPAFRVSAPALALQQVRPLTTTFTVDYLATGATNYYGDICVGWPAQAQTAFTYAANIWASLVQSSVPIKISACWANMGTGGILGHGGARTFYRDFTGAPQASTWYPIAIRNALYGSDANGSTEEMVIAYNGQFTSWYFGTDGACPGDKIDFVQVILHEMCHGLGFAGSMSVSGGQGSWGMSTGFPISYDRYAENGAGQQLINTALFANPSVALNNQLVSGSVYFDGPNTTAANGGSPAKLYAPATWAPGSSYSHLDEVFNGTVHAMMTYAVNYGESIHDPGSVTMGILRDSGWPTWVTLGVAGSPMAEAGGAATVTATLSGVSSLPVTVNLSFSGTATVTADYTRSGTSITIPAGSLSGSITLTAVQDTLDEANETVTVDISTVTNGKESGTQQVTATITDDDVAPTVTLGLTGSPMAEAAGVATVTATLSAASSYSAIVNLAFSGTATLTDDYTRSGTSITIPAGSLSGSITLTAVQDALVEAGETIVVDMSSGTYCSESGTQQVTATITDDDTPTIALDTALDNAGLTWTTGQEGGGLLWYGQSASSHDGVDAAQSGTLSHLQTNWIQTTVTGPGFLFYWWTVSSEGGYDYLSFTYDGVAQPGALSGTTNGWTQQGWAIPSGVHTLRWVYSKNSSLSSGSDCGWVDQVVWRTATQNSPVSVPFAWLDEYGITVGWDYEAAALTDGDGDGYTAWQEYVAGTVPTNHYSLFLAQITATNGGPRVTWSPNLGASRLYSVEGKSSLTNAAWVAPTNAASRFFRVNVSMP